MNGRRENTLENTTLKNGGKTTKSKTLNQMVRPNYIVCKNERGKLGRNTRKQKVGQ